VPAVESERRALLICAVVGLLGAAIYALVRAGGGRWLIDDAAITYAFARNLAEHGSLAAYPGGPPVEGYSNPLMFFLVAGLQAVGLFHPLHTHLRFELLEFGLLTALVVREAWWMGQRSWAPAAAGTVAFLALELSTPGCMVWYSSGLETLQASLALAVLARFVRRAGQGRLHVAGDGALAGLAALVRPEAPAYLLAAIVGARLALPGPVPSDEVRARRRTLARAAALALAVGALYLGYRLIAFGFFLPNTYYAKTLAGVTRLSRLAYLPEVLRHRGMSLFLLLGLGALARTRPRATWLPLAVLALASLALPLHHGRDWMGEHRFAIPFFFMVHLVFALGISAALATPAISLRLRRAIVVGTAALACLAVPLGRSGPAFMRRAHVTAQDVAIEQGFRRLELQRRLGLLWPVVGLPDVGGSLLVGGMQLLDTGWLADLHLARIQSDEGLVHLYETRERRMDLAEDHAWSFDRAELGRTYLDIYRSPDPAWEGTHPADTVTYAAASRNLFDQSIETTAVVRTESGLLVAPSPRFVPIAVPGALVRVELLVQQSAGRAPSSELIRVSVAGERDQLRAFTVVPEGGLPLRPPPGRSLRQGFLLRAPREPGRFPLRVTVGADSLGAWRTGGRARGARGERLRRPRGRPLRGAGLGRGRAAGLRPGLARRASAGAPFERGACRPHRRVPARLAGALERRGRTLRRPPRRRAQRAPARARPAAPAGPARRGALPGLRSGAGGRRAFARRPGRAEARPRLRRRPANRRHRPARLSRRPRRARRPPRGQRAHRPAPPGVRPRPGGVAARPRRSLPAEGPPPPAAPGAGGAAGRGASRALAARGAGVSDPRERRWPPRCGGGAGA
jgi:hypothetical protein